MMYKNLKIDNFLNKLSSKESMPGGGVAAALVAAEGSSLGIMVCNLTIGKEKYKKNEKLIIKTKNNLEILKKTFLAIMDKDAKIFKKMEKVFLMPKNTEEEKENRKKALELACEKCCEMPKELIIKSKLALQYIKKIKGKSNISASSDLEVAQVFLVAAIKSAWENIDINLKFINNNKFKAKYYKLKKHIEEM